MMIGSFNAFLYRYRNDALKDDVTWRAYDIPAAVRPKHVKAALKLLGLAFAGEHAIPYFCALYEVPTWDEARAVLGAWWLWSLIVKGKHPRVPRRPGGATTLAGQSPEAPTAPGNRA